MEERGFLAERFEENRAHLRGVAYRMLGSSGEAEDAVQEAWLRLSRSDTNSVDNLGGWLTTVVARVSLDMLRSRRSRREQSLDVAGLGANRGGVNQEYEAFLSDAVGMALLVVLETLGPAERVAFVLHDIFDLSFDEIAPIVDRSPTAARQLASRARRRVQGVDPVIETDYGKQRSIVDAFRAAYRSGDFADLLAILDPEVVVRADRLAMKMGSSEIVRGADAAAKTFAGRAQAARLAIVDGAAGLVWTTPDGRPKVVFRFTIVQDKIVGIELLADGVAEMEISIVGD